jgi:hypothetical protein
MQKPIPGIKYHSVLKIGIEAFTISIKPLIKNTY